MNRAPQKRRRYHSLRAAGICVECDRAATTHGYARCLKCRARNTRTYAKRQAAMPVVPCPTCGCPRRGQMIGFECRSCAAKRRHRRRKEMGLE